MVCLSGFELYSRWVPLEMERKNHHLFQSLFVVASRIICTVWVQFSPGYIETATSKQRNVWYLTKRARPVCFECKYIFLM